MNASAHRSPRARQHVVVSNHSGSTGESIAYRGPAFGRSNLAPHLGTVCRAMEAPVAVPAPVAPPVAQPSPAYSFCSLTAGTGWGRRTLLTLCHFDGFGRGAWLYVTLAERDRRNQPLVSMDLRMREGPVIGQCEDRLSLGGLRITLKPRALALAVRWLEQRGIEVEHMEIDLPF